MKCGMPVDYLRPDSAPCALSSSHGGPHEAAPPKPRAFIRAVNGRPVEAMLPAAERAEGKWRRAK
jgi:hypothetical protein